MNALTNKIILPKRINYLHYGDALEQLQIIRDFSSLPRVRKTDVLAKLKAVNSLSQHACYIIERYGSRRRKTIDVRRVITDLENSIQTQLSFRALQCRGFSYDFSSKPAGFPFRLRQSINIRATIFADTRFNYPPAVLKFLTYTWNNHFFDYYGPAIGFLLGILKGTTLYIVTLQSDFSYNSPSAVKEHFKGWRRILLNLTIAHYQPREIFLVRSEDVLRACHSNFKIPEKVPLSWNNIYEKTAIEFGNKVITLDRGLNIQIYSNHPKVIANRFYSLKGEKRI